MLYQTILRPFLFRLPPETAHEIAINLLNSPYTARTLLFALRNYHQRLNAGEYAIEQCGLKFSNPIGIAAGFDKNGIAVRALAAAGFGFVEVGTVTAHAQPGNPRPRIFRLPQEHALINRLGFNNHGAERMAETLASTFRAAGKPQCVLGINIGKSRATPNEEAVEDYLFSFERLRSFADYIAVNVSSPNTPHLRELQRADALFELLDALQKRNYDLARDGKSRRVPLFVKIAPDLTEDDLEMIVDVARRARIDGIIATNTTINRAQLAKSKSQAERIGAGGISGAPLRQVSTKVIAQLYNLAGKDLKIIGVGGVFTAHDAWEKISAGASLVQIYTGLVYQGIGFLPAFNRELHELMRQHGFDSLDHATGHRARELSNLFATTR